MQQSHRVIPLIIRWIIVNGIKHKRSTASFNFKTVSPEKIVQSVYDTIKHRFKTGGFSIELSAAEKMPDIVADFDAMVMVLLNLLDNAYHYSEEVKSVTLGAYPKNGNICFEVGDKGIGLSPDQRKKILAPFYQVDQTLARKGSDRRIYPRCAGFCELGQRNLSFVP